MKTSDKVESCPFCGEQAYHHQIKPIRLKYKSYLIRINQPGYFCDACEEGVIGGKGRQAIQAELDRFRKRIDFLSVCDLVKSRIGKLHETR